MKSSKVEEMPGKKNDTEAKKIYDDTVNGWHNMRNDHWIKQDGGDLGKCWFFEVLWTYKLDWSGLKREEEVKTASIDKSFKKFCYEREQ